MSVTVAAKLIKTLSGPEKRFFKLNIPRQEGRRDYLDLFRIVGSSENGNVAEIKKKYLKLHPATSIANTSRYLVKMLMNSLVQAKSDKDPFFQSLHVFMEARILKERSLVDESLRLLDKGRKNAGQLQQHFIEYLSCREELNYLAESNFAGINDTDLINKQMKAKDILRGMNYIQDHYSLLELLKYRLLHTGKVSSQDDQKRLNDLVLSEMTLMAGKSKDSFASQKLHLMFQSFFFTDVGDYTSALKTFHSLNKIFGQHGSLLDHPPLDYLSALNGILDSLHALRNFDQMLQYTSEVSRLDLHTYPEYFRYQVRKTIAVYQLVALTGQQKFAEARTYIEHHIDDLTDKYPMVDEEKQWELHFYGSLVYFRLGEWKKSHQLISRALRKHRAQPQLLVCKAIRLLNLVIYFELGDMVYLEYEVRAYKRTFQQSRKLLDCENLLLRTILLSGQTRKILPAAQQKKIRKEIDTVRMNKYENQLLKFFDFTEWIERKFSLSV